MWWFPFSRNFSNFQFPGLFLVPGLFSLGSFSPSSAHALLCSISLQKSYGQFEEKWSGSPGTFLLLQFWDFLFPGPSGNLGPVLSRHVPGPSNTKILSIINIRFFNNRFLRERGMASNPKMEYQVFLCIFQKNSAMVPQV